MGLQRIHMKLCRFSKFIMTNWTLEVGLYLFENYEKLLMLREIGKKKVYLTIIPRARVGYDHEMVD